ncbi:MAG: prepilin-type N-terminal cleavage/methylation domain-containing protein, partial [Planctomycetes bacterium]|nr:prepilin-type N-terminal cleavage/methylation domain-containing protein [Planctomycetota bacterium]
MAKRKGVTLVEMMVVVAIAALMVGLTIPAANMLLNSFESESGAKSIISAAMASARAIAAKEQRYAGIRFQKRYDPNNPDPLNAPQYIIFVVYDYDKTGLANGFRAVDGIQPIKLPDSIGLMDLLYNPSLGGVTPDVSFANSNVFRDTTTFSIVFSPSGKLIIHNVQVRNRKGDYQPSTPLQSGYDDVFNLYVNIINNGLGMFVQDDYPLDGLDEEPSRNSFIIYDTKKFKQAYNNGNAYS